MFLGRVNYLPVDISIKEDFYKFKQDNNLNCYFWAD
mgnify:CR=1 FL=1